MFKKPPRPTLSRRLAERQEGVFAKLQPLARRVEGEARRRPDGAVPDALRAEAEGLLFEAQPFRERRDRDRLPVAAPHLRGLAVQLAEALSALLAFETRHSRWDEARLAQVWKVEGDMLLVRRLRPKPGSVAAHKDAVREEARIARHTARMIEVRAQLALRLAQSRR